MRTTNKKRSPSDPDEVQGKETRRSSAPEPIFPDGAADVRAFAELITRGAEEINDHLSLVARIQVKIAHLLETSIEELERAQRLETLTSYIAGEKIEKDGSGLGQAPLSENPAERPGAYLEREIKILRKMQKLLGIQTRAGDESDIPKADLVRDLSSKAEATKSGAPRKILIVNHDPNTVRILRYFLEKEDYEVLTCSNGPEGLKKAAREKPDLILLDILLPEMDGHQVLRRLKRDERTARIPVFVLSVLAQEADVLKAIESGAADYFIKPFSPPIVVAKIRRALRVSHA